jgi:hypothetical protein
MTDSSVFQRQYLIILIPCIYQSLIHKKVPKIFLIEAQTANIGRMKGMRFIIFLLSILLLTISSGLLFYKNLFLLDSSNTSRKIDFEELHTIDQKINTSAAILRKNLASDVSLLNAEMTRLKELLAIITDLNISDPILNQSIQKIKSYFESKNNELIIFKTALVELTEAVRSLNADYNDLNKFNIKFTVDKKDFYRECIVDALYYLSLTTKENENRLLEDIKILGQILNYATTPNPQILKFSKHIEVIHQQTGLLDAQIERFNNESTIDDELIKVSKYYRKVHDEKLKEGEVTLQLLYGAIVLYLMAIIFVLRKRH